MFWSEITLEKITFVSVTSIPQAVVTIFRKNLFVNSLMLLPYTAVIRCKSLIDPIAYTPVEQDGAFINTIYQYLPESGFVQAIMAILLLFVQGWSVNILANRNRITKLMSNLPGFCYILLMSIAPGFLSLNPLLIGSSFLLIAVFNLFQTYKVIRCSTQIFNAGFFLSIAGLCYFPFIYLLIAGFIGLISMRSFKIVEKTQYLVGILVAFFLVFAMACLGTDPASFVSSSTVDQLMFAVPDALFTKVNGMFTAFFAFLFVMSLVSYNSYAIKKSIQVQKKIDILFWLLIFGILSIFLVSDIDASHLQILCLPLAFFVGMNLLKFRNIMAAELLHIIALAFLFVAHFQVNIA